jgi:hypothetical protein
MWVCLNIATCYDVGMTTTTSTHNDTRAPLSHDMVPSFVFSGRSIFTLLSKKTGVRYTYKVETSVGKPSFVSLLTAPDTYTYIGAVFTTGGVSVFRHTKASRVSVDAPSFLAFTWFVERLGCLPTSLEVWHEGRCGRCGRALTDPDSIRSGFGPTCRGK